MTVIILYRDGFPDVILRDAQFFFHTQLYGQSVRVPPGFAGNVESLHTFVAQHRIFDGTGQDVVNTGMTIG